jgi:hypothetical protein
MNGRLKRWVIGISIIVVGGFVLSHMVAISSTPFTKACDFALHDKIVQAQLGDVKGCKLGWWSGYSISFGGLEGTAEFDLDLGGRKQNGELFVEMRAEMGEWNITAARLKLTNGNFIRLIDRPM